MFIFRTLEHGAWSQEGCSILNTNLTHTTCQCTHLTHFALLMDMHDMTHAFSSTHRLILTCLTIVGSVISCVCICLTLVAFRFIKIVKKTRKQSTTKDLTVITTHLCACLLGSLVAFLCGIFIHNQDSVVVVTASCSLAAMVSHYLFLCSFFWMLLEGVQLYLMLVRIFVLEKSPVRIFCLIAYGAPLFIVSLSKMIDYYALDSLGYGTKEQ